MIYFLEIPDLKWMIWGKTHHFRKHPYNDWNVNDSKCTYYTTDIVSFWPPDPTITHATQGILDCEGYASSMGMRVPLLGVPGRSWTSWLEKIFFVFSKYNLCKGRNTTANNLFFSKCDLGIKGMFFLFQDLNSCWKLKILLLHGVTWVGFCLSPNTDKHIEPLPGPCPFFHHICWGIFSPHFLLRENWALCFEVIGVTPDQSNSNLPLKHTPDPQTTCILGVFQESNIGSLHNLNEGVCVFNVFLKFHRFTWHVWNYETHQQYPNELQHHVTKTTPRWPSRLQDKHNVLLATVWPNNLGMTTNPRHPVIPPQVNGVWMVGMFFGAPRHTFSSGAVLFVWT